MATYKELTADWAFINGGNSNFSLAGNVSLYYLFIILNVT